MPTSSYAEDLNIAHPQWWGELSKFRVVDTECSDLNGKYALSGVGYTTVDGNPTAASQNGYAEVPATTMLSFGKILNSRKVLNENNKFVSLIFDEENLNIIIPSWGDQTVLESYSFSRKKAEYECINGWIKLKADNTYYASEFGHKRFVEDIYLTKMEDGSLLAYLKQKIKTYRILTLDFGSLQHREVFAKFVLVK
jgi:hypothetical protein